MKFENFLEDMGQCPPGTSIERKDNDGNYEPSNCVWATQLVQARNTCANVRLTIHGVTKCVSEWAEVSGIKASMIRKRLHRGWDITAAIFQPPAGNKKSAEDFELSARRRDALLPT